MAIPFLEELERVYGPFPRPHHHFAINERFAQDLSRVLQNRSAEVIMVLRRPDGRVLLHTKSDYPPGAWRLPSGGVNTGETPPEAARREIAEETGLPVQRDTLLGAIRYSMRHREQVFSFLSYVFLAETPGGRPAVQDPDEDISGYRWIPTEELNIVAAQLRQLDLSWRSWGQFRALAHTFVARQIQGQAEH